MCERRDAREAQNAAADQLAFACQRLCENDLTPGLRKVYDSTLFEPIPFKLSELLRRLG